VISIPRLASLAAYSITGERRLAAYSINGSGISILRLASRAAYSISGEGGPARAIFGL
jgi:hypothetical protein